MRSAYQQPRDICARTTHCTFFEWTSKREVREYYSAIATVHIFMECRQNQSACVTYNALWERDYIYRQLVHWSVRLKAVMDDEAEGDYLWTTYFTNSLKQSRAVGITHSCFPRTWTSPPTPVDLRTRMTTDVLRASRLLYAVH